MRNIRIITLGVLLTILGKLFSLSKDIVLANMFGSSFVTDSYFAALAIPTLVWSAGYATISSVFLPMYLASVKDGSKAAQRLAREGVRSYFVIASVCAVLVWCFAEPIVSLTLDAVDPATKKLAVSLTRILTVGFIFTGYVEVQNVLQRAHGRFLAPLFIPSVNNAIGIIAIVIGGYFGDITIAIVGATFAWIAQAPIQRFQTRDLYKMNFSLRIRRETMRKIAILSGPIALAVMLDQVNLFIGIALASEFGAGAISYYNYASRLAIFAAGLFSWLIAYFFFPQIAKNAFLKNDAANGKLLTKSVAIILLSTAPLVSVGLAMKFEIVIVIFGRGAFTQGDAIATATIFGFYGLGILFIALREILNRTFFAYQNTTPPLLIGIAATLINLMLSYLLSRFMGVSGIALGASIAALFYVLFQIWAIKRWKPVLVKPELAVIFSIVVASGVIAFVVGWAATVALSHLSPIVRLVIGSSLMLTSYVAAALTLLNLFGKKFSYLADLLQTPIMDRRGH